LNQRHRKALGFVTLEEVMAEELQAVGKLLHLILESKQSLNQSD